MPALIPDDGGRESVGIVMLAAGGSTRMGTPKQLLPFRGRTLLRHAALTALESVCRPVVIVLGARADALRPELDGLDVLVVENRDWPEGMSGSLRVGMQALMGVSAGAEEESESKIVSSLIVMLCDQPFVTPGLLNRLAQMWQESDAAMIACEYGDSIGVPALFDRSHFPELLALEGAMGAKQVLLRHTPNLERVSFAGGIIDVDTPADYARLSSSDAPEDNDPLNGTL
jgi:molybdenum cofactor cytidylyltransferase